METDEKILLIDDDKSYCQKFSQIMQRQAGLRIDWINDIKKIGEYLLDKSYGLVLLDIMFGDNPKGFEILKDITQYPDHPAIIMLTNSSEVHHAVKAIKMGAYDFIEKNSDLERIELTIKNGLKIGRISGENKGLRAAIEAGVKIIGTNEEILSMIENTKKISFSDQVVLITGETGTGKELVARLIHASGNRAAEPFIAINCAEIQETLTESQLFGHEKGAFTGADRKKDGAFIVAGRGILFLDEIGDLSKANQAKILRALEEKSIRRLGGFDQISVNARVITATRKNIKEMVKSGEFREDLYYRLNVLNIHVPALRERKEDIIPIFEYYLAGGCNDTGNEIPSISEEARIALLSYDWPGNIRELKNLALKISLFHESEPITNSEIKSYIPEILNGQKKSFNLKLAREAAEKDQIEKALKISKGNVENAASILNESASNLYKKMQKLGIKSPKMN